MKLIVVTIFIVLFTTEAISQNNTDTTVSNSNNNDIQHLVTQHQSEINLFSFEASYNGNLVANMAGGIRKGTAYIGMGNIMATLETAKSGLWNGGTLYINGAFLHGESPSDKLIGDFQVASNISAGNRIYLHEIWYSQEIGNFKFIAGLQDLNVEFVASDAGSYFLNSSFGIPSVIADNIPAPIFPMTTLGITAIWNINDEINLRTAIYDGKPTDLENNFYNTNWDLNTNDGALLIAESQFNLVIAGLPGTYKAGYYYHSGLKEDIGDIYGYKSIFSHNHGAYIITDHQLWENDNKNKSLNSFMQLSFSPQDINNHNFYLGGGLVYSGIFTKEGSDNFGLAFAHASFKNSQLGNETALEMFYKIEVNDNICLQPDLQYIINPLGGDIKKDNALVLFIKTGINF